MSIEQLSDDAYHRLLDRAERHAPKYPGLTTEEIMELLYECQQSHRKVKSGLLREGYTL